MNLLSQGLGHETFCSVGNDIISYDRTQIVRSYKVHDSPILGLLIIGHNLISFDESSNVKVCYDSSISARESSEAL